MVDVLESNWGDHKVVKVDEVGELSAVRNGVLISYPTVGMDLTSQAGMAGVQHRVASWELPVTLKPNEGLHGVRAAFHWFQARSHGVRGTIVVSVGNACTTLVFPPTGWTGPKAVLDAEGSGSTAEPQPPIEESSGTFILFDTEDWPADTQFDEAPQPGRKLSIPIVITIIAHQVAPDGEYQFAVDDLDLWLFTYDAGSPLPTREVDRP